MTSSLGGAQALCGGLVYAVVGTVPTSRPTSWIAPHLVGWMPVPCYVLRSGTSALIIDTGLAVHWSLITAGLDALLDGVVHRSLIVTRREPDALCNLPGIVERYRLQSVYCGGVINPLDFFDRVDQSSAEAHIRSTSGSDVSWLRPGSVLSLGELELLVLPTLLRVLPKNHLYERRSRTLFGSDTWSLVPQPQSGGVECVREDDDRLSIRAILDYLRHRFGWLTGIDTSPMQQEIAALAARYPIERICSSSGCVIEGRELVALVLRRTIEALGALSHEPPPNALAAIDSARLRDAIA